MSRDCEPEPSRGDGGERPRFVKRLHRMPFGAELQADGVRFRLWAPAAREVAVRLEERSGARDVALAAEGAGWFGAVVAGARAGTRYRYLVDRDALVPDPASRSQPAGVHGPSEVLDPAAHDWTDADWRGRPFEEAVVYELHVGAFTPQGTFAGVAERLPELADLGVTAVELMPIGSFAGSRNWGYDGVLPYAPAAPYGRPEELKRLVERAHGLGLMVLLDVVYNHFGPEGNHLQRYAPPFFTSRHATPWGDAIDFRVGPVREFFVHNALYWLEEYHLDGLRVDAVHAIREEGTPPVLDELARRAREACPGRELHLVLENDRNEAHRLVRRGGRPSLHTAQWNDDFHHALHVLLTGERDGYYEDYADRPADRLGRCLCEGFAYQGEPSRHRGARRGEPTTGLPPTAFVNFLQNHDQVGNRAFGERLASLAPPEALDAAAAVLLLAPGIPLLFMGEEWGCERPFPFFCDFEGPLAHAVREGRRREFARFEAFRTPAARARIPDPCARETFERAVLHLEEREREPHRSRLALYRELLAIRRRELAPRLAGAAAGRWERLGPAALRAAWRLGDGARLSLVTQLAGEPAPLRPFPLAGRALFARPVDLAGALAGGALPAWSAGWFLEAGES